MQITEHLSVERHSFKIILIIEILFSQFFQSFHEREKIIVAEIKSNYEDSSLLLTVSHITFYKGTTNYLPTPTFSLYTLFNQGSNHKIRKNAAKVKIAFVKKKFDFFSKRSHIPESTPESLFPIAVDRNQPPIINAAIRFGANFETRDSPIGLKQSSPIVITP